MWEQFWIQNSHYVVEVFVGFLMVTAGWIYLDGWLIERKIKTFLRSVGFLVLAVWSFLGAAPIEEWFLSSLVSFGHVVSGAGIAGFGLLFVSLLIDPVPVKPGEKPIAFFSKFWERSFVVVTYTGPLAALRVAAGRIIILLAPLVAGALAVIAEPHLWMFFFAGMTAFLLWLHYGKGIQSEWRYFYLGFVMISASLLAASVASLTTESGHVLLARLASPFHALWIVEHALKLLGGIFLGVWAWGFIRFRIFPQIFSSFIALAFIIFVTTTIAYTGFLLKRTQSSIVKNLETNVRTLDFALRKVKESSILAARIAATNPRVRDTVRLRDREALFENLNALMFENETDFMFAVNAGGEVLVRAEDKDRFGESIAEDPVVWRALDGKAAVTTAAEPGITTPTVVIKAGSPIVDTRETGEPEIIGAIITGFLLDTAFVDGVKKITDLDVTIYADDTSAATTFASPESELRLIGARELDESILDAVLKKGVGYTGSTDILNQPFLAAYIPIRDIEETVIGMFFTGRSQASILAATSDTMQLTFSISILLMVASILPLGWLARFISYNQEI